MTEFIGPHRIAMNNWIDLAPFERYLGMEIVAADQGRALLTMPFVVDLAQGAGLMHGGALVSLADTAVVMAIKSLLPPATHFATTQLQAEFSAPVRRGVVAARALAERQADYEFKGIAEIFHWDSVAEAKQGLKSVYPDPKSDFSPQPDSQDQAPVMKFSALFKISKHALLPPFKP